MSIDVRQVIQDLCVERGEDFASLSRMLGRNPAYIQQFIKRGTPRRLKEDERRKLARYFGISESALGAPEGVGDAPAGLIAVTRTDVRASAGAGALPGDERSRPYFGFDERWLKALTASPPDRLSILRVDGDSMSPTLNTGDDILVDLDDVMDRLRDGIYVLRVDDALVVKRLALNPVGRRVTVQSDNPAYPDWPDCDLGDLHCIGRVIWAGRRIS
jgi:phage repressor protein C with HTH and peptisase S24 domain